MSVQQMVLQDSRKQTFITNRTLGAVGMILSPMLVFGWLFHAPQPDQPPAYPFWASLGGFLYLLGATASATAMRNLRVTGSGTGAKVLYVVQAVGLFLAMWFDILGYAAPLLRETTLFFITDMAYPFSHMLMNIVGIAIIRGGEWRGWRRIPAFLVGLALPSFFGLMAIVGHEKAGFIFPLMVTTGFFTLGLAVFTTKSDKEN
jgi:hypothetical protein